MDLPSTDRSTTVQSPGSIFDEDLTQVAGLSERFPFRQGLQTRRRRPCKLRHLSDVVVENWLTSARTCLLEPGLIWLFVSLSEALAAVLVTGQPEKRRNLQLRNFYFSLNSVPESAISAPKTKFLGAVRNDGQSRENAPFGNSSNHCWYATARRAECREMLEPRKIISFFPPRTEHPQNAFPVGFVSAINEQMTAQKCGLYCVLQNYPFANYIPECELCLCGLFADRLPQSVPVVDKEVCIGGTGLVGVGIHATVKPLLVRISRFAGLTNFTQVVAGDDYELALKIWHWNRLGFVKVIWDLGNDSLRPNDTVEIQNNGFGFVKKKIKYSTPGVFRLRIFCDDGFNEVFRDVPIEVLPSEGKTPIAISPAIPAVKETVTFHTPEFSDADSNYMWFFQDSISFAETTSPIATKAYTEPGVYRVDAAVTSSNISKTGSIDIVVEEPLKGLHVKAEGTVDTNRIITVTGSVDGGTNYDFALVNGHGFVDPVSSPTGRFRVLYSQPGLYNLSITARNPISRLQAVFSIRVVDPDTLAVRSLDFPSTAVVNDTTPLRIVLENESELQKDSFVEWYFSDNTHAAGPGLLTVRKIFKAIGDAHVRIVVIGKKGSRKVFHAVISVVTLCSLSPLRGVALDTQFRFSCRGSKGPLPGLEIHHAIIANPILGFYELLYPKSPQALLLPDPLSTERNWTVAFPGKSQCDLSPQCGVNCCPIFNVNATGNGFRTVDEIISAMDRHLNSREIVDRDHLLSVLVVQCSILIRTNSTRSQLSAITKIVGAVASEVTVDIDADGKMFLGGHLYDLLTVLTWSEGFRVTPEDAARISRFLSKFVRDVAPHTNLVPSKSNLFALLKRLLAGLPSVNDEKPTASSLPVVDLLRPLAQLVGSYVNDISDRPVQLSSDLSITAVKTMMPRGESTKNVGGVAITIPAAVSAALANTEVVLVVGKSSQNWAYRDLSGSPTVFSISLLDRNYTELDMTSYAKENGVRIVLPSERSGSNGFFEARLSSLPSSVKLNPRSAARFRITRGQSGHLEADRFYVTVKISTNGTDSVASGKVNLALLDDADKTLEKRTVPYAELRISDAVVRWSFPATNEPKFLSVTNEGGYHMEMNMDMYGTGCVDGRLRAFVREEETCQPDASTAAQNMRTCICSRLSSFGGKTFEVHDFLILERTVDLLQDKRSAITVAGLTTVAMAYIIALIVTALHYKRPDRVKHVLSVGSGKVKLDVLFWRRITTTDDFKGGLFPLRMHICGSAGRLEHVLSFQRQIAFGSNLLVTVFCDRHPGSLTGIRITGRLAEASFPFHYATILDSSENSLYHYRLTPPRLIEESRGGGVVLEVSSTMTSFSCLKVAAMEFGKRLRKDHVWVSAVQARESLMIRLEMLSVAMMMLFAFMSVCSLSHSFLGAMGEDVHELTRPFRPRSRDLMTGLWSAIFVTPLATIIVEILHRCHHRSAKALPVYEMEADAPGPGDNPLYVNQVLDNTSTRSVVDRPKDPHSHGLSPSFTQPLPAIIRMNDDLASELTHSLPYSTLMRANSRRSMSTIQSEGTPIPDTKSTTRSHFSTMTQNNHQHQIIDNPVNNSATAENDLKSDKEHSCSVPPVCRQMLAYILCFTLSALSICIVLVLGLNYSYSLSLHWLLSVVVAFIVSFFLIEPLKVIGKSIWVPFNVTGCQYFQKMFARCRHGLPL